MENNHSILYNYYSKYGGNPAINRIASSAPSLFKSVMHDFIPKSESFSNMVLKGVRDNIRDNVFTEISQGNNPFDTFKKNIEARIKNSDEYLYNKLSAKEAIERSHEVINQMREAAIKNRDLGLPFDKSLFTPDSDKYNFDYKYEPEPESDPESESEYKYKYKPESEYKNGGYNNMYGGKLLEQLRIDIGRTNFDFELNKLQKEILEIRNN
jgi:hypothetical protein